MQILFTKSIEYGTVRVNLYLTKLFSSISTERQQRKRRVCKMKAYANDLSFYVICCGKM